MAVKKFQVSEEREESLGFGWGYFWIIVQSLTTVLAIIFLFTGRYEKYITLGKYTPLDVYVDISFMIIFSGGSAIGLLMRKKWGLYLVYGKLILGFINGAYGLIINLIKLSESTFFAFLYLLIGYLWFSYFYKRRNWFK